VTRHSGFLAFSNIALHNTNITKMEIARSYHLIVPAYQTRLDQAIS